MSTDTDQEVRRYPFETFRGDLPAELLRRTAEEPVSRVVLPDGRLVWLVAGYAEVRQVLSDPRFDRRGRPAADLPGATAAGDAKPGCPVRDLVMDGAAHSSLRRVAQRPFTARSLESHRWRVQEITDRLLAEMVAGGPPADLVAALIAPLPILVICALLGVSAADRERVTAWDMNLASMTAYGSPAAASADAQLRSYLARRLAGKRDAPGDDLLSDWIGQDELTDAEIVGLANGVLRGGWEVNSTSAGLRALFLHPAELARLRTDPGRMPAVIEEILRYTTVSPMFRVQTVAEDLDLGGTALRAGDAVMAVPWAANRDPAVFPDPNVFNPDRAPNPHLGFGYGPHFCLGAALGRLEIEVVLGALMERLPRLAPAVPLDELPWRNNLVKGGLAAFPVTW
jgi:cytochrome P450